MNTEVQTHTRSNPSGIPAEMRAGVYRGNQRVGMERVPVPEIQAGEILIRVAACGICGTDVKKVRHDLVKPPQILGHEIAGTVVEAGAGVDRWSAGDRVVSFHHIPCGHCFYCERQLFSQCAQYKNTGVTAGFTPNGGGFAEYVRVMPHIVNGGVVAIPDDVTFEQATFVEPVNTCLKAVRKARIAAGEVVFVIGQGPVGLLLAFLARAAGATVFTSDPLGFRRTMSMHFGAEAALDPAAGDAAEEIRSRRHGIGADAVLLAVPDARLVPVALNIARPGGRVLLFAQNDPVTQIQFPAAAVGVEEKEILGSYSAAVDCQEESARIVFENRTRLHELISHRFALDDIDKAFAMASHPADNSLKLVILP
ncbi:MAG TPA: alcohol dehydrogenase catalytic domain-containing protein [Terriglobia bacterium]|jgi:L-iditol 2-dehydrogenase